MLEYEDGDIVGGDDHSYDKDYASCPSASAFRLLRSIIYAATVSLTSKKSLPSCECWMLGLLFDIKCSKL